MLECAVLHALEQSPLALRRQLRAMQRGLALADALAARDAAVQGVDAGVVATGREQQALLWQRPVDELPDPAHGADGLSPVAEVGAARVARVAV